MGISELRAKIDEIDSKILKLLESRAQIASEIGETKRASGDQPAYYDPERELKVLERLCALGAGLFPKAAIAYVFREIIGACRSLETPMKIAYLGPAGTFSQNAALRCFGNSAEFIENSSIRAVFEAVERGQAEYGVVPFENSAQGGVKQSLEAFLESPLKIRSEITIKIDHSLLSNAASLSAVLRVYSHTQALSQCRDWLRKNLPNAKIIEADSTAAATKLAAEDKTAAAIASRLSAELHRVAILREGIQDQVGNATRFVVVGRNDAPLTGRDRTSFYVVLKDKGNALKLLLEAFAKQDFEITKCESFPDAGEKWRQGYFIDLRGHRESEKFREAWAEAQECASTLKILGSYPEGNSDLYST